MFKIELRGSASGLSFTLDNEYETEEDTNKIVNLMKALNPSPMFHTRHVVEVTE